MKMMKVAENTWINTDEIIAIVYHKKVVGNALNDYENREAYYSIFMNDGSNEAWEFDETIEIKRKINMILS